MDAAWDTTTQEVHGGQTWSACPNFVCDFSVTTNAFGPPAAALAAATKALSTMHHYPPADNAAALAALSAFTRWPQEQLLLGNGASEFIDLVMRALPEGPFKPGPYIAAYKEYHRAARAAGRDVLAHDDTTTDPAVTVIIHPNSPTGDCMSLQDLDALVSSTKGVVVVDESFMPFRGATWRDESALCLLPQHPERLIVLASWTKIWSCPGIRIGSIASSPEWTRTFKKLQTPWSVNVSAQAFTVAACKDDAYMRQTWDSLPKWKLETQERIRGLGWKVNETSPSWVPWVFVHVGDRKVAAKAVEVAMKVGCPIRPCASFGLPEYIRLGVRRPEHQAVLFKAWKAELKLGAANGCSA
ncbi:similar to histidinol-phosphate aminotransferase [Chondrus crispus]|uniref:Similar to histidinol-phosphate aminotransferase n=1 Tax=Chondrus crispus TaxID=2769 RepID=R7Q5E8_CHOCR|nr:similar to histidinol-phosphate aminotransferase [Chondrus crispus]CDF33053.1 similar to histidinol-phosphate aminotransferase [Chondrus crispus]|eukprot:XP_005712856.1 similar to histidinol-phosphate aminotransferase [Chondrus crispus]